MVPRNRTRETASGRSGGQTSRFMNRVKVFKSPPQVDRTPFAAAFATEMLNQSRQFAKAGIVIWSQFIQDKPRYPNIQLDLFNAGFSEHKQYEELLWWPLQHLFAQYVKAEDAGTGHVRSAHEYRDKAMVAAIKRAERHDWIGGRLIPLPEASIPLSESLVSHQDRIRRSSQQSSPVSSGAPTSSLHEKQEDGDRKYNFVPPQRKRDSWKKAARKAGVFVPISRKELSYYRMPIPDAAFLDHYTSKHPDSNLFPSNREGNLAASIDFRASLRKEAYEEWVMQFIKEALKQARDHAKAEQSENPNGDSGPFEELLWSPFAKLLSDYLESTDARERQQVCKERLARIRRLMGFEIVHSFNSSPTLA